jgi:hypothetical protein
VIDLLGRIGEEIAIAKVSQNSRDSVSQSYNFEPLKRDRSRDGEMDLW